MAARERIEIPDEVFGVLAGFVPRLFAIMQESCSLGPIEFYVLLYIRTHGRRRQNGDLVCPRQKLTLVLTSEFRYTAKATSVLIDGLHNAGLVKPDKLTAEELNRLYGSTHTRKAVVTLDPKGLEALQHFRRSVQELFDRVFQQLSPDFRSMVGDALEGFLRAGLLPDILRTATDIPTSVAAAPFSKDSLRA